MTSKKVFKNHQQRKRCPDVMFYLNFWHLVSVLGCGHTFRNILITFWFNCTTRQFLYDRATCLWEQDFGHYMLRRRGYGEARWESGGKRFLEL